jgi:uncharacterized iron-regulated membrane protein
MGDPVKTLRTILFWCHLTAGAVAGVVILIMSLSGALLSMKPQILNLLERRVRFVAAQPSPMLSMSTIVAAARARQPESAPVSVVRDSDPASAVAVAFTQGPTVYVDPYTGSVLGDGSVSAQTFFRTVENWHRWLAMSAENRTMARGITGASNVVFFGLALSGLYLWWPRSWSVQHTRAILRFKRGARGRARDFNWHNVIGFWCAPVIIVMTATGVVMSYPWANALLYRVTGSPLPVAGGGGGGERGGGRGGGRGGDSQDPGASAVDLDRAWARAEQQLPTWRTITMRLPARAGGPVTFTMSDTRSWNAFARSQLTLDAAGDVRQWQPYEGTSLGQKARGWVRFGHTGELGGLAGQLAAGIACCGGVFLVYTGLALAIRRFRLWAFDQRRADRLRRARSASSSLTSSS